MSAAKAIDYYRVSSGHSPGRGRLTRGLLSRIQQELSERDLAVLRALARVNVLSGSQLERLLFTDISGPSRARTRRRVLGRLVELGLVVTLERRVGGVRAGSAGLVYSLSAGGHRLLDGVNGSFSPRRRNPITPGQLFLGHALAISEAYVALVEAARATPGARIEVFDVEVNARWDVPGPGRGEVLRPDALAVLTLGAVEDVWWLEVDRGSESLPRLERMLRRYLRFAQAGVPGPRDVIPRVLVSVTSDQRLGQLRGLVERLPAPASELFVVCREQETAGVLIAELVGASPLESP